jgi:ribosomal protein S18 acetylase RimI-like enzyme
VLVRVSEDSDITAMALIRAAEWGEVKYWENRISGYLDGRLNPQLALESRSCYVAVERHAIVGFAAGHLTRRYACDGEIEWINVMPEWRRRNIASGLLRALACWFAEKGACRVCVDVDPANAGARAFYRRHGAEELKKSWLVWSDISVLAPSSAV